jgi:outer membrane protein assembly factor BamE
MEGWKVGGYNGFRIFHRVGMSLLHRFSGLGGRRAAAPRMAVALATAVGLAAVLVGCGSLDSASNRVATFMSPYKIDIVQGNFVSREQAALLRVGMPKTQVRDLLGTPLLTSVFHGERWDFPFTFVRQGQEPQSRRVTVYFKGDVVERFEADNLPTEAEFVSSLDSGRSTGKVPVLQATPEMLARIAAERAEADKARAGANPANPAAAPAPRPSAVTAPDRYPPLESTR